MKRLFGSARVSAPAVVTACTCLTMALLYVTNPNMAVDPGVPRGDGHYRPIFADGDGHMLFLMTRSTVLDGDWNFDNDLARFGDPWVQPVSATGRKGIPHPIGPALVWAPFFVLAHGASKIANLFGAAVPSHGYTALHQRIVFASSVLFGCGAVLFGRRLAGLLYPSRWAATFAAAAVLLGTSLTYYTAIMASYGHAMDAFTCAAFLFAWATTVGRRDAGRHVLLGLLLGLAALVRIQEFAMGIALAVEIAFQLGALATDGSRRVAERLRDAGLALTCGALTLSVALIVFTPQLLMWKIVYGAYRLPQGEAYTRWGSPMIAELLFSARNGWFPTTPIAYLSVIGLALVPKRARTIGWASSPPCSFRST